MHQLHVGYGQYGQANKEDQQLVVVVKEEADAPIKKSHYDQGKNSKRNRLRIDEFADLRPPGGIGVLLNGRNGE